MKQFILISLIFILPIFLTGQEYQPYILGTSSEKAISELKSDLNEALKTNAFDIVGEYQPAKDKTRWVVIVSHKELLKGVEKEGGLRGFASTLRVALTVENGKTVVSYTNPVYWGRAYYQDVFSTHSKSYELVDAAFKSAISELGTYDGTGFGSKKGLTEKDLVKYHYMMGMPYFDDTEELAEFDSYAQAINHIDAQLKKGVPNVKLVYKLEIPNRKIALYGVALSGEDGESKFLPIIDVTDPKHTAFLPYEFLVVDGEVHMLHGRFRIALSFPDLTMGTFTKIMSTPGDIEDMLEQIVE